MKQLPTTCPECYQPGVTYSTSMIHSTLPGLDRANPVIRCDVCRRDFFLPPSCSAWELCSVSTDVGFTKDPDAIDPYPKLAFAFNPVVGGRSYTIAPALQG
jgi:hypothetical protein